MKKSLLTIIFAMILLIITGCGNKNLEVDTTIDELFDINNKITIFFNDNGSSVYDNLSYNYVDEKGMVVVVGLVDNSEKEQKWFKKY